MAKPQKGRPKPPKGSKKGRKKCLKFLDQAQNVLSKLTPEKVIELLDVNGEKLPDGPNPKQVLFSVSKLMAFGVVKPCPWCGGKLVEGRGYTCTGKKEDKECEYKSFSPPHKPFVVPKDFSDHPFFKNFRFQKFYQEFDTRETRPLKEKDEHGYKLTVQENKFLEQYYKGQEIVPEGEWDEFIAALKVPLPSTFRVTGFGRSGKELLKVIQSDYLNELCDPRKEVREVEPPKCLSWYPDNLAWQLDAHRREIRHVPAMERLKDFLVTETNSGNISRQEAVSMIPPLLLDVKPHHKVLDMCAAPGSKTAQLIEALHADENVHIPEGIVIGNDSENKRCYLMCHQVKRLQTPSFIVTNHDASQFPGLRLSGELIKFDRVLADVPCTGDGTLRKNADIWQKWNAAAAYNLHPLQSRILKRGLEMLETGGRLVYSTCSFNPVEDEAVLANVLTAYGGEIEILDVSSELPGLKYMPGKYQWKVMSRAGEWFSSMSEVPQRLQTQINATMFPPSLEVAQKLHLERCMRILPHQQNTGGFFIAVLHKTEDAKDKKLRLRKENAQSDETNDNTKPKRKDDRDYDNAPPFKKQKFHGHREDPFIFLEDENPNITSIKSFYGLEDDFPVGQLLKRSREGKDRNLYFVSEAVKRLVESNEDKVKFINMGIKMFSRSESRYCKACSYRLVQEGIEVLYPYMHKRLIQVSRDDLLILLRYENPFITQLSPVTQAQLSKLDSEGCIVFVFDPDSEMFEKVKNPQCKVIVTGWKGVITTRTFLPRSDVVHYTRLCGEEVKTRTTHELENTTKAAGTSAEESRSSLVATKSDEDQASDDNMDSDEGEENNGVTETDDQAVDEVKEIDYEASDEVIETDAQADKEVTDTDDRSNEQVTEADDKEKDQVKETDDQEKEEVIEIDDQEKNEVTETDDQSNKESTEADDQENDVVKETDDQDKEEVTETDNQENDEVIETDGQSKEEVIETE